MKVLWILGTSVIHEEFYEKTLNEMSWLRYNIYQLIVSNKNV